MKIIKHGTPKPKQPLIAECKDCGCVFTFEENESIPCSNNGGGHIWFFRCPDCGSHEPCYDSGYPGNSDRDRASDDSVKAEHARLWAMVPKTEVIISHETDHRPIRL